MKTHELLESGLKNGYYTMPYHAMRSHRAEFAIYNYVLPELAKTLGLPKGNVKLTQGYAQEVVIKITSERQDADMIKLMAAKALKNLLEKAKLVDVETHYEDIGELTSFKHGRKNLPLLRITYSYDYPEEWKEIDRKQYGHKV